MELSYTGSLDQSTRASEHVTVQISLPIRLPGWQVFYLLEREHVTFRISYACKTTAGFINCFPRINFIFDVYLTKLHRNVYILSTVGVVFVGRLVCSVNVLYMELSYTGSLDRSTRASEHVTFQISLPIMLPGWQVFIIV